MDERLKYSRQCGLKNPVMVVGWSGDAGKLGTNIIGQLARDLAAEAFCTIKPVDFFPLNGITIENDLVQFPESKFYAASRSDVLLFESYPPNSQWHRFLSLLLDVAEENHVRELYVLGGMISLAAHSNPREIMGTCNSIEIKRTLGYLNVIGDLNYETPASQKPTLNSYLLWAAQKRGIPAVSMWIPVPFYLVNVGDYEGQKLIIDTLEQRFQMGVNGSRIDEAIRRQNFKIAEARRNLAEVDDVISKLESNLKVGDEERQKLLFQIDDYLKEENIQELS